MGKIRSWYVTEALVSMRRLHELMDELTEGEILAALELESGTRRRHTIINRLISRATRFNEITYNAELKEKYHAYPSST